MSRVPSAHGASARLRPDGVDVVGIRADNPGILSLSGTNSWIVGRNPGWLIDPGPELTTHLDALEAELASRGGLAGIALTHRHADHTEAVSAFRRHHPGVPVAAAAGDVDVRLSDGARFGPLEAIATPGHAADHLAYAYGPAVMTGDAVLGEGSVFIAPGPGALRLYLAALARLRDRAPTVLCPGHGPLITSPADTLDAYIAHRRAREEGLLTALAEGLRTTEALLDRAWADVPVELRPAAAVTLAAHLDKLAEERRLPADVERPAVPAWLLS